RSPKSIMLTTEEKLAVLNSVNLFIGTSDDQLESITNILTEADFPANTVIFEKKDPGDCMYIVIVGRLGAHDGDRTLNYLTTRDIFGEMALLDAQPRTATVTTIEDSRLLRIDHEPFCDLLATLPEVGRGVIRVLSQRLRARVLDMHEDFM